MVPTERSYHREYSMKYQRSSTYCSKVIIKVKVSERRTKNRITEWQTGQKQYAPDLRSRGHKNHIQIRFSLIHHYSDRWIPYHLLFGVLHPVRPYWDRRRTAKLRTILQPLNREGSLSCLMSVGWDVKWCPVSRITIS